MRIYVENQKEKEAVWWSLTELRYCVQLCGVMPDIEKATLAGFLIRLSECTIRPRKRKKKEV